ncbi:DNA-J protein, putative [Bodo saltans]|uniref:DNA-J protein, putative n=1 Tax=Bodo saltans TaxID=75058 RepID=A0A0S4JSC8_BODSA|nr:DNA-J protein, putative [Bodo saltans]|eukprot:CUG93712.1 DNA-J protein, putative [Bodo saltans]
MPSVPTNLYDVLGVHPNASKDEIRRQYKRLALQYHPDKNIDGSPSEKQHAELMFKAVARAYEILHDESRRRQYDLYGQEDDQQQAGGGGAAASSSSSSGQHFRQSHPQHSHSSSSHRQQQQQHHHSGASGGDFPFDPFVSGMFGGMGGPSFFGHHHHHPAFGGGGVRGGSGGGHPRHPFDMFSFTDPFELFERMMGREFGGVGGLPFPHSHHSHHQTAGRGGDRRSEPQHHHHAPSQRSPQQHQHSNNVGMHRMGGGGGGVFDMFSQFDDMFASHASMFGNRGGVFGAHQHPAGMSFMTSSSSSNRSGGGGVFESVSTVTEIRNGQRVTKTVRRSQDANGVVREHVDEEVADVAPSIHQQQYHRGVGGGRDAHRFLA